MPIKAASHEVIRLNGKLLEQWGYYLVKISVIVVPHTASCIRAATNFFKFVIN